MKKQAGMLVLAGLVLASPAALAQQQSESLGQEALRRLLQGNGQSAQQEEDSLRQMLEQRGYTDVGDVKRIYRTTAQRDGREVTLNIDAETGRITSDGGGSARQASDDRGRLRSESAVRDLLNDEGYTRVSGIRRDGDSYRANAERDGEQLSLVIDAETGDISER